MKILRNVQCLILGLTDLTLNQLRATAKTMNTLILSVRLSVKKTERD